MLQMLWKILYKLYNMLHNNYNTHIEGYLVTNLYKHLGTLDISDEWNWVIYGQPSGYVTLCGDGGDFPGSTTGQRQVDEKVKLVGHQGVQNVVVYFFNLHRDMHVKCKLSLSINYHWV